MATLSLNEIRARAAKFAADWAGSSNEQADKQTFWNEFFEIFGVQRRSVATYEQAINRLGRAKGFIDLFWPGKLIVEHKSLGKKLDTAYDQAADYAANLPPAEQPRYIITSDFRRIKLYDLDAKNGPISREIFLTDLPKHIDLFSFIAGYEKQEIGEEDPVNRQAAEKLAKLHDELKKTGYVGKDLEILLVRLLFCLFAEDSTIFGKSQFHDFIYNRTEIDGSDLGQELGQLFETLNKSHADRQTTLDETVAGFPYVNGGLFDQHIDTPTFDYKMRDMLLDSSHDLDWSLISPAIFGAMFQGVMDKNQRRGLGAHYTSETNIMKVIKPLFLDDLWAEFERVKENRSLLNAFHDKLARLTFMDPACGCGNFLVVAYRELRRLELEVLKIIYGGIGDLDLSLIVKCNVDQFYGIEIEEFPAQIAQVAMWLTDVQMNNEATDVFGKPLVRLPLTHTATIKRGDALANDWQTVISPEKLNYLFGNPPFVGSKLMTKDQRAAVVGEFEDARGSGVLDFVTAWYARAAKYMLGNKLIQCAFVSTNSISQGEQVSVLWKYLLAKGLHINFAHQTFKWSNEGRGVAGVYCVIVGFGYTQKSEKFLYVYHDIKAEPLKVPAKNINPYLVDAPDALIESRQKPICDVPPMSFGNMPLDGGNFLLNNDEKNEILNANSEAAKYIRPFIGAKELLNGGDKWCLWLANIMAPGEIKNIKSIYERLNNVHYFRVHSQRPQTVAAAATPMLFGEIRNFGERFIVLPRVSSENRNYIPMGFFDSDSIPGDTCQVIPNATLYHFGILTSQMHMAWVRAVCGRLESRYRYSKDIVYNNFIWPEVGTTQTAEIEKLAQTVLDARAAHPDSTLADLYDPPTMPQDLRKAHKNLDRAVDRLYAPQKFPDDSARTAFLFQKYQELIKNLNPNPKSNGANR
ncbi:MAG: DNA methyltransferase [Candidatus Saccharimonadales bacterium]